MSCLCCSLKTLTVQEWTGSCSIATIFQGSDPICIITMHVCVPSSLLHPSVYHLNCIFGHCVGRCVHRAVCSMLIYANTQRCGYNFRERYKSRSALAAGTSRGIDHHIRSHEVQHLFLCCCPCQFCVSSD